MSILKKLETLIVYTFKDAALFEQSVTHRSFGFKNNERLEFLGDSILNFVIASELFRKFPDAAEGDLSRLRAKLVNKQTLSEIAREISLGGFLKMGSGELKSGGFARDSILSDAVEAIIGAVYIDGGTKEATDLILRIYEERLAALKSSNIEKDAKSRLQEYLQSRGEPLPSYVLVGREGKPPNENFQIECRSVAFSKVICASGSSRRLAEQGAAVLALNHLQIIK